MYRPTSAHSAARYRHTMLSSLGLWLAAGSLLLLTGLLPVHSALLGWSLPFWLVLAPVLLTLTVAPGLPGEWLRQRRSRRILRTSTWV